MATLGSAPQAADPAALVTDRRPARPLVILGGGEHARVVADAARSCGDEWRLVGFTDLTTNSTAAAEALDLEHLGSDDDLRDRLEDAPPDDRPWLVLGLGDLAARRRVHDAFPVGPTRWATVTHASAVVAPSARLGAGAVVLAGAIVNPGAHIGTNAIVNSRAVIEHDAHVGDFAHVGPAAVLGGGARIGENAFVGLGALVRDHVAIGRDAVVGMGSVVVEDVPAGATVVGSPARERRPDAGR